MLSAIQAIYITFMSTLLYLFLFFLAYSVQRIITLFSFEKSLIAFIVINYFTFKMSFYHLRNDIFFNLFPSMALKYF